MPSHIKGTGCCMRHKRHAPSATGVQIKKNLGAAKAQARTVKPDAKKPFMLPLKRKPNGIQSYRFGGAFRKLKQSSLSDHQKDVEDLIVEEGLAWAQPGPKHIPR